MSEKKAVVVEAGNATARVPATVVTVAKPPAVTAIVIGFVFVEPETAICAVDTDSLAGGITWPAGGVGFPAALPPPLQPVITTAVANRATRHP